MSQHNVLYALPNGDFKSSASYSARSKFKHCKRLFKLTYIDGWSQRRQGASLDFGKIVEAAVQHHTSNLGVGGRDRFLVLWDDFKKSKDFDKKEYSNVEQSWENMRRIGDEWMQLFAIRFKSLPFALGARFQVPLRKKIFPGTSYDTLTNTAYLDILVDNHPQFPGGLIIDCKTASKPLPEKLIMLDPQLVEYGWMYGTTWVGFLWFVKKSHGTKFGSRVTLLQDHGGLHAGDERFVLEKVSNTDSSWLGTQQEMDSYNALYTGKDGKTITGKAAKGLSHAFFEMGNSVNVPNVIITKQIMQFATAKLPQQDLEEMGKMVGQVTIEMVVAHETGFYPMEPGLRFPAEKCVMCDMRHICSDDKEARDKFLTKDNEEWMDSFEEL